jgi:hypothetical protein
VKRIGKLIAAAVVLAVIAALFYGAACALWPYTDCGRCEGRGKFRSPSGKAWRRCRKCKGSGDRIRLGRRMWTRLGIAKNKIVG